MNLPAGTPASIPLGYLSGDVLDVRDPSFWPDVNQLITEDDSPADNPLTEKQMRLLTEPLYSSWRGPSDGRSFRVLANVGLYNTLESFVPDVMLGLGVRSPNDLMVRGHRAWFVWIVGKVPDLVVEIVSNREGGEDSTKKTEYARMGIPYYVIHDPENILKQGVLRGFGLHEGQYAAIDPGRLPQVELGLKLWQGRYEDVNREWLRWCDDQGQMIPTGAERAAEAAQVAIREQQARVEAEQRLARLEAQLRAQGIEPAS